jgi:hypothetical protein
MARPFGSRPLPRWIRGGQSSAFYLLFSGSSRIEKVHPLQFGIVRRKIRTQRRHGMKIKTR